MSVSAAYRQGFLDKVAEFFSNSTPSCLIKKAYGVYDEYEYTDRIPPVYIDPDDDPVNLKKLLKKRIKYLNGIVGKPLYPGAGVDDRLADVVNLSKYRYHEDPDSFEHSEISLSDYEKLVNDAIAKNSAEKLKDAAEYWSMSAKSSLDPYPRRSDGDYGFNAFLGGLLGSAAGFGKTVYDKAKYDKNTDGVGLLKNVGIGAAGGAATLAAIYAISRFLKNRKKRK